ncbi:ABC transporter substrate-binding protein [soil metagenome]
MLRPKGTPIMPMTRRGRMLRSLFFGGAAAMPAWAGRAVAAENGILRARIYNDINRLDPAIYENAYNVFVMDLIYPKLIGYKPNSDQWEWQLEGAEEIEQLDDTHIRFRLRDGLRWSGDHGAITAEDVKFSFERVIDPEMESPVAGDWGPLSHVEVEDELTGVIVLTEPFQPLWTIALPYGVGHIVSKAAVEAAGGGRFAMDPPDAFGGPYRLREWRAGEVTILERNEAWTGEEPAFDEIRLYPIPDEQAGEIAFEAGDVDFTQPSAASLERYRASPPAGATVEEYPALFYVWVGMNMEHPNLQDQRVRQAVQYAINVPLIIEAAYFGVAPEATGIIAPGLPGHRSETLIPPEGDPERARELLAEAGAEGLELRLAVRNTATMSTVGQIIQANLQDVGITCHIDLLDSGVFWTIGMESEGEQWRDVELILNRFSSSADPYYATQWFITDQIGEWNWERFSDARFDELHEAAMRETDLEARDAMYREMQDIMEESGAYRFITHEVNAVMYRDFIRPALRPDGIAIYNYFERA